MFSDGKRASDRAIELILAFYSAFNRGDWEGMLAMLSEDVAHDLNQGQREIGRDAFRTYITRMQRCYSEQLRNLVVTTTPDGTHAAAEYVVHGEYKTDDASAGPPSTGSSQGIVSPPAKGQRYVLPGGAFFDVRGNRIARVTNYFNLQDWVRQLGEN